SPWLTCEEAFLLAKFLKGLSKNVRLALGPAAVIGADDTYPKDRRGKPAQPVKFTIRAEKCPNRRGVEEILKHFEGRVRSFADVVAAASEGKLKTAFIALSAPPDRCGLSDQDAAALAKIETLIVQDFFSSALTNTAKYVLPATAFSEKE